MKNIAETFIREKLVQEITKSTQPKGRPAKPVGYATEDALRETLNEKFSEYGVLFESSPQKCGLLLSEDDFKKTTVINSNRKLKVSKWRQCDLHCKNSKVPIMGEVKTTTSAKHNTCGLINKNLTAYRKLESEPFSVVLYPDMKAETLRQQHTDIIKELCELRIISEEERQKLKECFFILTNIGYKGGLKGRIDDIDVNSDADIESIIESDKLIEANDLNYEEWERLLNYITNIIKG